MNIKESAIKYTEIYYKYENGEWILDYVTAT